MREHFLPIISGIVGLNIFLGLDQAMGTINAFSFAAAAFAFCMLIGMSNKGDV